MEIGGLCLSIAPPTISQPESSSDTDWGGRIERSVDQGVAACITLREDLIYRRAQNIGVIEIHDQQGVGNVDQNRTDDEK